MTLFKVDDGMYDHPKFDDVSNDAVALWVRAGSWCCRYLKDGFVPLARVPLLRGSEDAAAELVRAGLWHRVRGAMMDGYQFHDWSDLQDSKADVEARRRKQRHEKQGQRAKEKAIRKMSATDSAADSVTDSVAESAAESRIGMERRSFSSEKSRTADLDTECARLDREALVDRTLKKILSEPPPPMLPPPMPANEAERRAAPRTNEDASGLHVTEFQSRLGAVCSKRDLDAPVLGRGQQFEIARRTLGYARRKGISFAEACDAMIAQAFDDTAATGDKLAFTLGAADPGKPKPRRGAVPPAAQGKNVLEQRKAIGVTYVPKGDE